MTKWATAYILLLTSVSCSVFGQTIRLVSPLDNGVGRLEVYYNGTWGTVCDDNFDTDEAKVACRQLGLYKSGVTPRAIQEFGFGGGRIWLDDLSCSGTESSLASCSHGKWGVHDCQHIEDVGIICDPSDITMKLTSYKNGLLQVLHSGSWGTVCDDGFGAVEATVVCRALGYQIGNVIDESSTNKMWLDDVQCTLLDTDLKDCKHLPWGTNNCGGSEAVGVDCFSLDPPEVHLDPSNDTINVGVGEDLRVQCVVDDANPSVHTFRWSHNGRTSAGSTFIKRNVTKSDQGQLTCIADNGHMVMPGRADATVNVRYPPKIHLEPNQLVINVKQGGDVTVVCVVDDANPSVTSYAWSHNNNISHGQVFTKGDLSTSDAGNLSCSATNGQGTSLVMTKIIVNTYMPLVHLEPENNTLDVVVGEDLLVQCTVNDVSPTAYTFRWSHKGQTCTGSTFLIQNVTKCDRGQLSCTVDNGHMMAPGRTDATINVKYPPEIHLSTRQDVISVTAGNAVEVKCVVDDANPAVTSYMWRHNGDISYGQTFLKHVSSSDSGNLSCSATNEQRTSSVKTSIKVLQASSLIGNDGTTSKNKVIAIATGSVGIVIIVILLLIVIYQRRRIHAAKPENKPAENQQSLPIGGKTENSVSRTVDGWNSSTVHLERPSGGAENSYCEIEMTPSKDAQPAHIYGNLGFKDEENTRQEPGTASGPAYGNIQIGMSEEIRPKRVEKERKGRKPRGHKDEHVYENTVVRN